MASLERPCVLGMAASLHPSSTSLSTEDNASTGEAMSCAEQVLPEKEAKAITAQIVQGLAYLNEAPRHIIHYDLKPANIPV